MKDTRPSKTASWVAACRAGLGVELPPGTKLCDDPYGMLFSGWSTQGLFGALHKPVRRALLHAPLVSHLVYWMQVRTRFLDDTLLEFVRGGGRQVVILGAGFDCRAVRFAAELGSTAVFEVDHPATQQYKKDVLAKGQVPASGARFITLDFEKQSVRDLPAMLAAAGHDPRRPTLTIWEGVTMYLTEPAIEATLAAVREYSSEGSLLAFTYGDFARRSQRPLAMRVSAAFVGRAGEPWRFGWKPDELPGWMKLRGFDVLQNEDEVSLARRYLPPRYAQRFHDHGRLIAVAAVEKEAARGVLH